VSGVEADRYVAVVVPTERLNQLTKRFLLGLDPGPITPEEDAALAEIRAEIEAHPERTYWPSRD
jgi:hypothetical protein